MTKYAPHPGKILKEVIHAYHLSYLKFSNHIEYSTTRLNNVILGKQPINARLAVRLEQATGIGARYWMHAQAMYELDQFWRWNPQAAPIRKLVAVPDGGPMPFDRCICRHWGWEHQDYPEGPCLDESCNCSKYERLGDVVKSVSKELGLNEREEREP